MYPCLSVHQRGLGRLEEKLTKLQRWILSAPETGYPFIPFIPLYLLAFFGRYPRGFQAWIIDKFFIWDGIE